MKNFDNIRHLLPTHGGIADENISRKKVILITGSSSGLGLAIAKRLMKNPDTFLVLTSRESSQMKFMQEFIYESEKVWIRKLDVTNQPQIYDLIKEINQKLGGVDILINNAGITDRSAVEESTKSYRQQQLDVNYLAPFEIISQVLSLMRKKRRGQIINVSSAGGFMAMPTMSSYSASKFALEGATESLWYEMKPWNVRVTLVIPGFINSEGFAHTTESAKCAESIADLESSYHQHYVCMKSFIKKRMLSSRGSNEKIADKVAKIIADGNPPLRAFVTFDAWLLHTFRKMSPSRLYFFVMYHLLPNIKRWGKQIYRA